MVFFIQSEMYIFWAWAWSP